MAKFKYKFRVIFNLKIQLEKQAKNNFGKAAMRLEAEKNELRRIQNAIAMTFNEFRAVSGGRFTANTIKNYNAFIDKMKKLEEQQKLEVKKAEEELEIARQLLVKAMQEREKYEKLEEKEYERYIEDEKRRDNLVIDEIISYKIGSKSDG
jgi:flagellar FliJ protein